jgi:hypothetical protein
MTRHCNHAILPLLLSAWCKPWTLILVAPARRKHSAKTNYEAESWAATTVAKCSVIECEASWVLSVLTLDSQLYFFPDEISPKNKLKKKNKISIQVILKRFQSPKARKWTVKIGRFSNLVFSV